MKNAQKRLDKAYNKRFKQLNKNLFSINNTGLFIFVEHLKYLRDTCILENIPITDSRVASLSVAIAEFEKYQQSKKEFHWRNFCEFVKLNTEEWLKANDSI
jgi:hypothetical protein